jgi:hypothetical protein
MTAQVAREDLIEAQATRSQMTLDVEDAGDGSARPGTSADSSAGGSVLSQ